MFARWMKSRGGVALGVAAVVGVSGIALLGANSGNPERHPRLLSGGAWLASAHVGQLTLLDGASAEVSAQVQVVPSGDTISVVQQGSTAYAVDRTIGAIRRVDGATFEVGQSQSPIPDAHSGLTAFAAADTLYALDTDRGLLTNADPHTLLARDRPQSLAIKLAESTAGLDGNGRLWLIDNANGDLSWVSGGQRHTRRKVFPRGDEATLTLAGGKPVIIDRTARQAITIEPATGATAGTIELDLRQDDVPQVSGSPRADRFYLVNARGVLNLCELADTTCDKTVPLDSGGKLGPAVEAANRLFVPDYGSGRVLVIDLNTAGVIARPQVLDPAGQFELLTRDGIVFYNDPDSERAGVIQLDGSVRPAAKYNPKDPAKGVHHPSNSTSSVPQPQPNAQSSAANAPVTTSTAQPPPSGANPPPPGQTGQPPTGQPPTGQPPTGQLPTGQQPPTGQPPTGQPPTGQPPTGQPTNPPTTTFEPLPTPTGTPPQPTTTTTPPPPGPPQLKITMSSTTPTANQDVTLQVGTVSGEIPASAQWDFGDGSTGSGVTVTHRWATARTYQVSVQATMSDGRTGTTSATVQVTPAQPSVAATASANPPSFTGDCTNGVTFTFTAVISVQSGPAVVSYTWLRSDGAIAPPQQLTFPAGGVQQQTVTDTWTLSGTTTGWEAVQWTSPETGQSNHADISLTCTPPDVTVVASVNPTDYNDRCLPTTTFTFTAQVTVSRGPAFVAYHWVFSDGHLTADQFMNFPAGGRQTQTQTNTWSDFFVGDYWGAVVTSQPVRVESNQARFHAICSN